MFRIIQRIDDFVYAHQNEFFDSMEKVIEVIFILVIAIISSPLWIIGFLIKTIKNTRIIIVTNKNE